MLCTFKMNEYFYAVAKPYLEKTKQKRTKILAKITCYW